jgi:hypothetical protein
MHPAIEHVLKFFKYEHLPPHLRETPKKFHILGHDIAAARPESQETTVALRKLLEAKDAAVRAQLDWHSESGARRNFQSTGGIPTPLSVIWGSTMAKYRFQILRGRHVGGKAITDSETGKLRLATEDEINNHPDRANFRPAAFYKGSPFGDIVETDKNLLKFNSPGSVKFKMVAIDQDIVPDIDDGLETMTVAQLKKYCKENGIEIDGNPDNLRKVDYIKAAREALLYAWRNLNCGGRPMAMRAGSHEWRDLIDSDTDVTGSPFHKLAISLVDKIETNDTNGLMNDDLLLQCEKWLTAGFYAIKDPVLMSERHGEASGVYEKGLKGMGAFEANDYLKIAMRLDLTGFLAQMNNGPVVAGMTWLGLPPSGQTDFVDRD